MARTLLILLSLSLIGCGYSGYDDCVLEKMKGQDGAMLSSAQKVCERMFPFEKRLYGSRSDIELSWNAGIWNEIRVNVKKNESVYSVTKAKLSFSRASCDNSSLGDFQVTEMFFFESGASAKHVQGSSEFQCMRTREVYGKMIR